MTKREEGSVPDVATQDTIQISVFTKMKFVTDATREVISQEYAVTRRRKTRVKRRSRIRSRVSHLILRKMYLMRGMKAGMVRIQKIAVMVGIYIVFPFIMLNVNPWRRNTMCIGVR